MTTGINLLSTSLSRRRLGIIETTLMTSGDTWLKKDKKLFGVEPIPGSIELDLDGETYISNAHGARELRLRELVLSRLRGVHKRLRLKSKNPDLTKDQKLALDKLSGTNLAVIQGAAGTGKTFLIAELVEILRELKIVPTLLAPTGRAALNLREKIGLQAQTFHSYLRYDGKNFNAKKFGFLPPKLVIVDEAFMVPNECWEALLELLDSSIPIFIFGDFNQLYPVSAGSFMSDLIESNKCPVAYLTINKRFSELGSMLQVSTSILEGIVPRQSDNEGGLHIFAKYAGNSTKFQGHRSSYKTIPHVVNDLLIEYPNLDFRVLSPIYEGELGINKINLAMKLLFNPNLDEPIPIINKVNDYSTGIMNGDRGMWRPSQPYVVFASGKQIYDPTKHEIGYATSVHVAQGSESAVIFLAFPNHDQADFRSLYTGSTRAIFRINYLGDPAQLEKAVTCGPNKRFTLLGRLMATNEGATDDHIFRDYQTRDHSVECDADPSGGHQHRRSLRVRPRQ